MTVDIYKAQAARLAAHLASRHGYKLKHSAGLEAVAALHGAADWNTLCARSSTSSVSQASGSVSAMVAGGPSVARIHSLEDFTLALIPRQLDEVEPLREVTRRRFETLASCQRHAFLSIENLQNTFKLSQREQETMLRDSCLAGAVASAHELKDPQAFDEAMRIINSALLRKEAVSFLVRYQRSSLPFFQNNFLSEHVIACNSAKAPLAQLSPAMNAVLHHRLERGNSVLVLDAFEDSVAFQDFEKVRDTLSSSRLSVSDLRATDVFAIPADLCAADDVLATVELLLVSLLPKGIFSSQASTDQRVLVSKAQPLLFALIAAHQKAFPPRPLSPRELLTYFEGNCTPLLQLLDQVPAESVEYVQLATALALYRVKDKSGIRLRDDQLSADLGELQMRLRKYLQDTPNAEHAGRCMAQCEMVYEALVASTSHTDAHATYIRLLPGCDSRTQSVGQVLGHQLLRAMKSRSHQKSLNQGKPLVVVLRGTLNLMPAQLSELFIEADKSNVWLLVEEPDILSLSCESGFDVGSALVAAPTTRSSRQIATDHLHLSYVKSEYEDLSPYDISQGEILFGRIGVEHRKYRLADYIAE